MAVEKSHGKMAIVAIPVVPPMCVCVLVVRCCLL